MPEDYLSDLVDHKKRVAAYMQIIADELFRRACVHDESKFAPPEYEGYERAFKGFQEHPFGTPGYDAVVESIRPTIERHTSVNDHHPEFFKRGLLDMNLIQVVEMVCDWIASSERKQGDVDRSMDVNKERFGITDQLHSIMQNTVRELAERRKA